MKYCVIDKVNGDINAIHDESLELTEFKGCFRPFDLDDLETKIGRVSRRAGDEGDEAGTTNYTTNTSQRPKDTQHG